MAARVTPKKTAKKTVGRKTPARRSSASQSSTSTELALFLRRHAGMIILVTTAVLTGVALFLGYRAATAASVFELKNVDIKGENRLSRDEIQQIVRRQTMKTSVWNADVEAIRAELERSSWVKSAVVSRVLPDGLRVRVTERVPLFAVKTVEGNTIWIDEEARTLGSLAVNEKAEPPFLLNWTETSAEATRKANLNRLQSFRDVREAARVLGIADKLQSVDASELQEIKASLRIGENVVPIFLGAEDLALRLKRGWTAAESEAERMNGLSHVSHLIAHEKNILIVTKTVSSEIKQTEAKKDSVSVSPKKSPEVGRKIETPKAEATKKVVETPKSEPAKKTETNPKPKETPPKNAKTKSDNR